MKMGEFSNRLNECDGFACIFKLVKEAVEKSISKRRAGLILGLSDLPPNIGALYQVGSNFIVMNRKMLHLVRISRSQKMTNAYIFHILLHEYIHSLGFIDESKTQALTYSISRKFLGDEHPATLMARYGISSVIPLHGVENVPPAKVDIELVKDFENENLSYFV
jgi:hypothetical protein